MTQKYYDLPFKQIIKSTKLFYERHLASRYGNIINYAKALICGSFKSVNQIVWILDERYGKTRFCEVTLVLLKTMLSVADMHILP